MRRANRSPHKFWAGIVLLVCLLAGLTADAFGDCVGEALNEAGSTSVCLHISDGRSNSERPHPGHKTHDGSSCICPCHGLVLTREPGATYLPLSVSILSCTHRSQLPIVDLPIFLRPPIAG